MKKKKGIPSLEEVPTIQPIQLLGVSALTILTFRFMDAGANYSCLRCLGLSAYCFSSYAHLLSCLVIKEQK